MKLPVLGSMVDERFLMHRLRSTSIGGLAAIVVSAALYFYELFGKHVIRWDLVAIIATAAVVKVAVLIYYRLTD